jgi:hypothetical protein
VSGESLGGAAEGVHCDPDDNKKKRNKESLFPDFEHLTLSTPSPVDWLKMRQPRDVRAMHTGDREIDETTEAWRRGSEQLDMLGIDDKFKLWFITKNWILNKGVSLQIENQMLRDNPNRIDLLDREWSQSTGASTTIIPVFDYDWVRKPSKKRRR